MPQADLEARFHPLDQVLRWLLLAVALASLAGFTRDASDPAPPLPDPPLVLQFDAREHLVFVGGKGSQAHADYLEQRRTQSGRLPPSFLLRILPLKAGVYLIPFGGECEASGLFAVLTNGGELGSITVTGRMQVGSRDLFFSSLLEPAQAIGIHRFCEDLQKRLR